MVLYHAALVAMVGLHGLGPHDTAPASVRVVPLVVLVAWAVWTTGRTPTRALWAAVPWALLLATPLAVAELRDDPDLVHLIGAAAISHAVAWAVARRRDR